MAIVTRHYASWPNGSKASRAGIDCFSSLSITKNYKDASKFGASACSRIIKDEYLASINRARYNWKRKKPQPDSSLADYAISIRMQPNDYSIDIDVCKQKSDPEHALEAYNHATRIGLLCHRPS
jgi:hypothetical protein